LPPAALNQFCLAAEKTPITNIARCASVAIDWTLNLGHLLTAVGLLGGALGIVYAVRSDINIIKSQVDTIKEDLRAMAGVLVQIGKQDQQLKDHDRRITKLEDES